MLLLLGGATENWASNSISTYNSYNDETGYTYTITSSDGNIWKSAATFTLDIGNIIYNSEAIIGVKRLTFATLANQGDFYYYPANDSVYIYSASNPGTYYSHVELVQGVDFYMEGKAYVTIQDLDIRYCGKNGVNLSGWEFAKLNDNITLQRNNVSYCGGFLRYINEAWKRYTILWVEYKFYCEIQHQ